ncbi:hypothetical protein K1719_011716 [Acacia pycnantha]|nr:hypothetical protein K1719_011716 [Acacia pycnantha]
MEDDCDELGRRKRKVRITSEGFSGEESLKVRNESWMQENDKEQPPKSYRESLLQNVISRSCWWEWAKSEEDEETEGYGADTDFAKVLNPCDGINVDYSNPLCPEFKFDEKEKERLVRPFRRTLVVKLIGRQPSYGFMMKKLKQIWERKGHTVGYSYCSADKGERLTKPLVPSFNVEGQKFSIEYESLSMLCTKCGWYGHGKDRCEQFHKSHAEEGMVVETPGGMKMEETVNGEDKVQWKTVQRNRRPRRFDSTNQVAHTSSRFAVLAGDEGEGTNGMEETHKVEVVGAGGEAEKGTHIERSVQGEKPVQESRKDKVLTVRKHEGGKDRMPEITQIPETCENTSMSNVNMYNWRAVNMSGKENLHPGGLTVRSDFESRPVKMVVTDEDPYDNVGVSVGVEFTTPGAASKGVAAVLKDIRVRYNVDVVVILEPRISGVQAAKTIKNWGFKFSVRVEAVGFSGGIWLLWNMEELSVEVLKEEEQFIHCKVKLDDKRMLFTAVYASPCEQKRQSLWSSLHSLASEIAEPWLLAGDFNEIKSPLEQKGGGRVNISRCRKFNEWIQHCNLIDMDMSGPFFTWKWPKWEGLDRVYKRLDRCLCNVNCLEAFEDVEIRSLPRVSSDHHPILVKLRVDSIRGGVRNFRYEVAWQMHDNFVEFMQNNWRAGEDFHVSLEFLQQDLRRWNKEVFGKIELRKRRILNRLNGRWDEGVKAPMVHSATHDKV